MQASEAPQECCKYCSKYTQTLTRIDRKRVKTNLFETGDLEAKSLCPSSPLVCRACWKRNTNGVRSRDSEAALPEGGEQRPPQVEAGVLPAIRDAKALAAFSLPLKQEVASVAASAGVAEAKLTGPSACDVIGNLGQHQIGKTTLMDQEARALCVDRYPRVCEQRSEAHLDWYQIGRDAARHGEPMPLVAWMGELDVGACWPQVERDRLGADHQTSLKMKQRRLGLREFPSFCLRTGDGSAATTRVPEDVVYTPPDVPFATAAEILTEQTVVDRITQGLKEGEVVEDSSLALYILVGCGVDPTDPKAVDELRTSGVTLLPEVADFLRGPGARRVWVGLGVDVDVDRVWAVGKKRELMDDPKACFVTLWSNYVPTSDSSQWGKSLRDIPGTLTLDPVHVANTLQAVSACSLLRIHLGVEWDASVTEVLAASDMLTRFAADSDANKILIVRCEEKWNDHVDLLKPSCIPWANKLRDDSKVWDERQRAALAKSLLAAGETREMAQQLAARVPILHLYPLTWAALTRKAPDTTEMGLKKPLGELLEATGMPDLLRYDAAFTESAQRAAVKPVVTKLKILQRLVEGIIGRQQNPRVLGKLRNAAQVALTRLTHDEASVAKGVVEAAMGRDDVMERQRQLLEQLHAISTPPPEATLQQRWQEMLAHLEATAPKSLMNVMATKGVGTGKCSPANALCREWLNGFAERWRELCASITELGRAVGEAIVDELEAECERRLLECLVDRAVVATRQTRRGPSAPEIEDTAVHTDSAGLPPSWDCGTDVGRECKRLRSSVEVLAGSAVCCASEGGDTTDSSSDGDDRRRKPSKGKGAVMEAGGESREASGSAERIYLHGLSNEVATGFQALIDQVEKHYGQASRLFPTSREAAKRSVVDRLPIWRLLQQEMTRFMPELARPGAGRVTLSALETAGRSGDLVQVPRNVQSTVMKTAERALSPQKLESKLYTKVIALVRGYFKKLRGYNRAEFAGAAAARDASRLLGVVKQLEARLETVVTAEGTDDAVHVAPVGTLLCRLQTLALPPPLLSPDMAALEVQRKFSRVELVSRGGDVLEAIAAALLGAEGMGAWSEGRECVRELTTLHLKANFHRPCYAALGSMPDHQVALAAAEISAVTVMLYVHDTATRRTTEIALGNGPRLVHVACDGVGGTLYAARPRAERTVTSLDTPDSPASDRDRRSPRPQDDVVAAYLSTFDHFNQTWWVRVGERIVLRAECTDDHRHSLQLTQAQFANVARNFFNFQEQDYCMHPKDPRLNWIGEDAMVEDSPEALCVIDGIGALGAESGRFASMLQVGVAFALDTPPRHSTRHFRNRALSLLERALPRVRRTKGQACVTLAALYRRQLHVAALGDVQWALLRPREPEGSAFDLVILSTPQHLDNPADPTNPIPFALGDHRECHGQRWTLRDAATWEGSVEEGDVVLVASDGYWDNAGVPRGEAGRRLVDIANACRGQPKRMRQMMVADAQHNMHRHLGTPAEDRAQCIGKLDDLTVLCARVGVPRPPSPAADDS